MISSKALREERMVLHRELESSVQKAESEGRPRNAEERQADDARIKRLDELDERIESIDELNRREVELSKVTNDPGIGTFPAHESRRGSRAGSETANHPVMNWAVTGEIPAAMNGGTEGRYGNTLRFDLLGDSQVRLVQESAVEYRTMTTGSAPELLAESYIRRLEKALQSYGSLLRVATILRTPTGELIRQPLFDDLANDAEIYAENTLLNSDTAPDLDEVQFNAYSMNSKWVTVANDALNDIQFDWEKEVVEALGKRLSRRLAILATNGSGTGQPQGIVTGASLGHTTAVANTISFADLYRLKDSVDSAYWDSFGPSVGWMMHSTTKTTLRTIPSTTGELLWKPNMIEGSPDYFDGHPIFMNQFMEQYRDALDNSDGAEKPILFGDFSKFVIRQVNNIRNVRTDQHFINYDKTGFIAFMRADSRVINPAAIKYLQVR